MAESKDKPLMYFNGVNGATGEYGVPPMTGEHLARFIRGEASPENLSELKHRHRQKTVATLGVRAGVDPTKLSEAGWGIVFAYQDGSKIDGYTDALRPLLEHRRQQAGDRYHEYVGPDALRPGESKREFLARHGMGQGPADPDKVPYYLLLVGSPESIPYRFQSQLDVQYAVGRLHFECIEAYANYARSVVAAETQGVTLARNISFFGVANEDDPATRLSSADLVTPLIEHVQEKHAAWTTTEFLAEQATKSNLSKALGGKETPALLFTASHGMEFPKGHRRQLPHQGALLCQDWPGPSEWHGEIPPDFYFAGDDLASDASLLGLIGFHFACYGGGTPKIDEFAKQAFKDREEIAPHAFLASLPTSMLSHERGGALAAIAHVERAWSYSFHSDRAGPQTVAFESTLDRLLEGHPVGSALEYFDERYAELAVELSDELEDIEFGHVVDEYKLADMWTANNDARGYLIIGDPAVRLPVARTDGTPSTRPVLELNRIPRTLPSTEPPPESFSSASFATGDTAAVEFGIRDSFADLKRTLSDTSKKLASILSRAVDNMATLKVHTYTSSDVEKVTYDPESRRFAGGANLRASTRIALDGDLLNLVPERRTTAQVDEGEDVNVEIHERLWAIHREMVAEAQTNKVAFMKATAEMASGLLKLL